LELPITFFETKEYKPQSARCFVLMSFAIEFNEVYETIREAVGREDINFVCERADDILGEVILWKVF
jgi:hypothetical protein